MSNKYRHTQLEDGDSLFWGRIDEDGFPFKGRAAPTLTDEKAARLQPQVDFGCGTFNMGDPEHVVRYRQVMDKISNGVFAQITKDRVYDPSTRNWRIYLEWTFIYTALPEEL